MTKRYAGKIPDIGPIGENSAVKIMEPREWGRLSADQKKILDKRLVDCPIRFSPLAGNLGVKIKISNLPTGISGQIKCESGVYVIRVNRYEELERQRFTIAHELAHFLLHKEIIDSSPDGISDNVIYRSGAPKHIEYEANRLAAEIIMPSSQVEMLLHQKFNGIVVEETIERLAEHFKVSKVAMEIRLSNL